MRLTATTAGIALVIAACSGGSTATEELPGQWEVVAIADDSDALQPPLDGTFLTATITTDTIDGTAGCNAYGGSAVIDGSMVTFGPLASTLTACTGPEGVMQQEAAYLALLHTVDSWNGTDDGVDLIAGEITVIELEAIDTSLEGTSWNVIAVNNQSGGVQSVVIGSDPTIVFDDDSGVTGNTGCNGFFGEYTTDEDTIAFSHLSMTEMFCQDTAEQEMWIVTALETASTYTTDGQSLDLFEAGGSRLLSAVRG